MNYRSNSDCEQYEMHASWVKEKPYTKSSASPRDDNMFSNSSDLHSSPMALIISPSGERKTCDLTSMGQTSNPFLDSVPEDFKTNENSLPKLNSKHDPIRTQNRRRTQSFHRRQPNKIILTRKLLTARKQPKTVAVQTDESMNLINFPESIGDGEGLNQSFMDFSSSTTMEAFKSYNPIQKQYLSENQRKFLSFILMVILIFWLTSIILEVEIPAEFCRIALNYVWPFQSGFSYQEKELTFFEKCWRFIIE